MSHAALSTCSEATSRHDHPPGNVSSLEYHSWYFRAFAWRSLILAESTLFRIYRRAAHLDAIGFSHLHCWVCLSCLDCSLSTHASLGHQNSCSGCLRLETWYTLKSCCPCRSSETRDLLANYMHQRWSYCSCHLDSRDSAYNHEPGEACPKSWDWSGLDFASRTLNHRPRSTPPKMTKRKERLVKLKRFQKTLQCRWIILTS